LSRYYLGLKPRILVADLDILKQILIKEINIFTNRPVIFLKESITKYILHFEFVCTGCSSRHAHTRFFERSKMERNSAYSYSNLQPAETKRGW
jgi:hypothetical protein